MDIKKSGLFTRPIAHRGLHDSTTPENSLLAYQKAIDAGYAIEIDVRPIDDGTVVVFHDDDIKRMTNRDGYVCNLTKADLDEITLLDSDQKIPTFEEVLKFIDGRVPLLIEIKNTGKIGQLERDTLALLENYQGEFAVQSFNPYSLEYFKKHAPHILRGQLAAFFGKEMTFLRRYMLSRLKLNKVSAPDFISYRHSDLPIKYVTRTKLPVLAWTLRSNSELEKVKPYCDNIIFENFVPVVD
ncbi:MAG: glycerophosphodiester phosphodiesterase [Clostridia bacterium]|nr:glycerophosphodiester phosphodiesterase [Clostridia bacterium]